MEKEKHKSRGFQNPMTDAEKEKVRELYRSGITNQSEIARLLNRSQAVINRIVREVQTEAAEGYFNVEEYAKVFSY